MEIQQNLTERTNIAAGTHRHIPGEVSQTEETVIQPF